MIEFKTSIFLCIIFILLGFAIGYFTKDNFSEPDINTDIDIELKKNKLFNKRERKIFKRKLFKRRNK